MTQVSDTPITVLSGPKPEAIPALRGTWRRSTEHLAEQGWRFVRLMMFASVVPLAGLLVQVITGQKFQWELLLVAMLPVFEGVYRQFQPALSASAADSAPGVTIVPEQVGVVPAVDDDGLVPVPEPVNTDNGPRPEDGSQEEVSQDPNVIPESDPGADDVGTTDAPPRNDEPVEEGS